MNKREFVAGGMAAVVAVPALAQAADGGAGRTSLQDLLTRTQRLPDLVERAGADAFAAYVGERFEIAVGAGAGEQVALAAVERVARCRSTEQFNVVFGRLGPATAATPGHDGVRLLVHGTGQRLALHLEGGATAYTARFNLLA
jgi:hypothetical protein